jgi:hypothetical protein
MVHGPGDGSSGCLDYAYIRSSLYVLWWQERLEPFPSAVSRDGASVVCGLNRTAVSHLRDTLSDSLHHGLIGIRTRGILLAKEALYH